MSYPQPRGNERSKIDKIEPGSHVVFLGGIPAHIHSSEVVQFLTERFGPVDAFKLIMDNVTGKHKGYGFARFLSPDVAESARRMKFIEFHGKSINLGDAYTGGAYQSNGGRRTGSGSGNGIPVATSAPRAENATAHYLPNAPAHWYPPVNPPTSTLPAYPHPIVPGVARGYTPPPTRPPPMGPPPAHTAQPAPPGGLPQRRAVEICRYWSQGRCRKGVNCPFVHSIPESEWHRNGTMQHAPTQPQSAGGMGGAPPAGGVHAPSQPPYGSWENRAAAAPVPLSQQQGIPPPMAVPNPNVHPSSVVYNYGTEASNVPPPSAYYPYYHNTSNEAHAQNQAWATGYSYAGM